MVQLKGKAELAKAVEPESGACYTIENTEEVKTAVQGFNGVRVELKATKKGDDKEYATMLWIADAYTQISDIPQLDAPLMYRDYAAQKRETAGVSSKLGAFLAAFTEFLGDEDAALDTSNWKGHKIKVISWEPRKREIAIIE